MDRRPQVIDRPRHFGQRRPAAPPRRRRPRLAPRRPRNPWVLRGVIAVPLVLLVGLVSAWLIDTAGTDLARNVQLAGVEIGGLAEEDLPPIVARVADDFSAAEIEVATPEATYRTTAREIGVSVDEAATTQAALDTADDGFILARPFRWATTFLGGEDAPLEFALDGATVEATIVALQGDHRVAPTEPKVELVDGDFRVVPGVDGTGIDPAQLVEALTDAAETGERPIRVEIEPVPIPPQGSEDEAQAAADRAAELLAEPLDVRTPGGVRAIGSESLRSWAVLLPAADGDVTVGFDQARVDATLREAFDDIDAAPTRARLTLEGGSPVIIGDQPGKVCCEPGSGDKILAALRAGEEAVDLALVDGRASFTTAEAQEWKITQAVGGNNAWRDGAPTTAEPGFTTYHACCGSRVTNIHRMADIVRGSVVGPGESFSINDTVGQRTTEKGFLPAGAIREGRHVDEVGGGVSQFATTMFNAAYFAGLDIDVYQAHSEYFSRYPEGREATMGYPAPDLQFTNNTPYGILIWTSYTDTSLTITLYSSPYATAEQTGKDESRAGRCRVVTTTRTRTFPDGHTEQDTFKATYRPGEGISC